MNWQYLRGSQLPMPLSPQGRKIKWNLSEKLRKQNGLLGKVGSGKALFEPATIMTKCSNQRTTPGLNNVVLNRHTDQFERGDINRGLRKPQFWFWSSLEEVWATDEVIWWWIFQLKIHLIHETGEKNIRNRGKSSRYMCAYEISASCALLKR